MANFSLRYQNIFPFSSFIAFSTNLLLGTYPTTLISQDNIEYISFVCGCDLFAARKTCICLLISIQLHPGAFLYFYISSFSILFQWQSHYQLQHKYLREPHKGLIIRVQFKKAFLQALLQLHINMCFTGTKKIVKHIHGNNQILKISRRVHLLFENDIHVQ